MQVLLKDCIFAEFKETGLGNLNVDVGASGACRAKYTHAQLL